MSSGTTIEEEKLIEELDSYFGDDYTISGNESSGWDVTVEDVNYYISNSGEIEEFDEIIKPTETVADSSITFDSSYGSIEVIWLSTSNGVKDSPNEPVLSDEMEKVTWTYSETDGTWTEDENAQSTWYNYVAGTGTEDNLSSMWANVKLNGSYFVWIPRYAYRITYYSDEEKTNITGYFDGYGCWSAEDGAVKYALDDTLETVTYKGKTYIVHPAFVDESNLDKPYDHGGWDSDLAGIWVGKYEVSGSSSDLAVVPNVSSLRNMTIGAQYTAAINYNSSLESHMLKNSEWGAVAYLTHSQYGRNGNEIDINNSSTYITGNGGGSTSASFASGITNAYNTVTGAKASSTGNVYGIYDLSGGTWERVAAFNNTDTNGYLSTYGWTEATGLTVDSNSTKYATRYENTTETSYGTNTESEISKIGDALIEVNKFVGSISTEKMDHWFSEWAGVVNSSKPFLRVGGNSLDTSSYSGVFASGSNSGISEEFEAKYSFRISLCV